MIVRIILFSCLSFVASFSQTPPSPEPEELYAGIEVNTDSVKALALRVVPNGEEPGVKLIYSETIHLALGRTSTGDFAPQAANEAAQAVRKLFTRLTLEHRLPADRIYLVGSSRLQADPPQGLGAAITKVTGKAVTFLDAATEVQLSIVGTIPQRDKIGGVWVDNRNSSVSIELGSYGTQGGYQLLKVSPTAPPRYEFVTMSIPYGVLSFANEISRSLGLEAGLPAYIRRAKATGGTPFRELLKKAREGKPSLLTRKRVYLSGDIVQALVTLLFPEERGNFVPLKPTDITAFADKAFRDPIALLKPNLTRIRNAELRREIEWDLESVRNHFTPQQLVVGAEMLKVIAEEFEWQEKNLWFARHGHLSRILSYVRLQAGK